MTIRRRLEALESRARPSAAWEPRNEIDLARRIAFEINRCLHHGRPIPAPLVPFATSLKTGS